jgi:hypothetical protein
MVYYPMPRNVTAQWDILDELKMKYPTNIMGVCHSEYHWQIYRFDPTQLDSEPEELYYTRTLEEITQREYDAYMIYKDCTQDALPLEDVPKNYPQPLKDKWEGLGDCFFELPNENTQLTRVYISSIGNVVFYAQRRAGLIGYSCDTLKWE